MKQYIGEKIPSNWEETVNSNNTDIREIDKNTNTLPSPIKTRSGRTVKPRQIFFTIINIYVYITVFIFSTAVSDVVKGPVQIHRKGTV